MNNNDTFTTPKQTKRLGLRRNPSALKETSSSKLLNGSVTKATTTVLGASAATTTNSVPRRLPQSDIRVNYRNLECKQGNGKHDVLHTPGTPKTTASLLETQRQAVSTNCRPYRLSLSKKVREKMTKKRLEFHLANELEKEEADETEGDKQQPLEAAAIETNQQNACTNQLDIKEMHENEHESLTPELLEEISKQELMAQIEIARKELTSRQDHVRKVKELQDAINTWKTGFSEALNDLQQKVEPRLDIETLLQHLHIPQEMLKYVND